MWPSQAPQIGVLIPGVCWHNSPLPLWGAETVCPGPAAKVLFSVCLDDDSAITDAGCWCWVFFKIETGFVVVCCWVVVWILCCWVVCCWKDCWEICW